jgi:hypothetical protein
MGERFYLQQQEYFGKTRYKKLVTGEVKVRKSKAELVATVKNLLEYEVPGLDKLTIASLEELINAIKAIKDPNIGKY